jgi:hypothetical protein
LQFLHQVQPRGVIVVAAVAQNHDGRAAVNAIQPIMEEGLQLLPRSVA